MSESQLENHIMRLNVALCIISDKDQLLTRCNGTDQRSGFRPDFMGQSSIVEANNNASPPSNLAWADTTVNPTRLFGDVHAAQQPLRHPLADLAANSSHQLPPFLRPLPSKIAPEDVGYLQAKGALTLPTIPLQNALLQAYAEYVHPYMPLMDLHPFLNIVNNRNGFNGQMSLLLYHAVMFSAMAYVDMRLLREAGFSNRKAARKSFFQKTRVCLSHLNSSPSTLPMSAMISIPISRLMLKPSCPS
jgi:hypothetical protein